MSLPRRPVTLTPSRRRSGAWRGVGALALLLLMAAAAWRWQRHDEARRRAPAATREEVRAALPRAWPELAEGVCLTNLQPGVRLAAARPAPAAVEPRQHTGDGAAPPAPAGVAGVAGAALGARPPAADTPGELPVFAALRASRGQPIPAEVAALARRVTADCADDAARARAIYDWITANIRYDVQEWAHITGGGDAYTHAHDPVSVLARGTTVCAGYAWLFNAMAGSVGLKSDFLIGDVRGYRGTADEALISAFKHAWNAVEIDGAWQLLDATWGARQTGEEADGYLARRDYYYNTPAQQMIFDHFPETSAWQLLAHPVPDAAAFRALPNLKPAFFRDGLRLGNAFAATLRTPPGERGSVIVAAPETTRVAATLARLDNGGGARQTAVLRQGTRCDIVVGPLAAGRYLLRVYSSAGAGDAPYDCAADFVVEAGD